MTVTAEQVTFWVFAIPLVLAAAGVVVAKNPVYAAMNLVAAFFFMAGIYVLLVAHLIAFMQILVYAGAVMVLFLFVIMLLSIGDEHLGTTEPHKAMKVVGGLGAITLVGVISSAVADVSGRGVALSPDFGTVKAVGQVLFTQFILPFEATSLLLLVAIVGAVVVAKERI